MSRDHNIVGQDVGLRVNTKLTAEQDNPPGRPYPYAIVGQTVNLAADLGSFTMSADQGTYNYTRNPTGGAILIGGKGFYAITGQTALLTSSQEGLRLDALKGSYSQVGQTRVAFTLDVIGPAGIYASTGQDIGEPKQRFKLTQGDYLSFGGDATLTAPQAAEGTGEVYTQTGQSALFQTKLFIDQSTYAVTGQEFPFEVVGQEAILDAQQGAYTLTGQDAGPKNEVVGGEQGTYTYLAQDALLTISLITEQGEYNYTPYLFLGDADETSYSIAGQDVVLRIFRKPVISQVGDDYPWKGKEGKDSARRRQSWREQDEARASLKRAVTDAIEGLEDRKDREAAKTLRQVRGRYLDEEGLLDFRRMLEDELKPIRKLLTEYAGRDYAQKVIQGYQAQIDKTKKEEETEEQELTKLLKAYQLHEKEQVQAVSQAMKNFTKLMERTTKNATKIRPGRN